MHGEPDAAVERDFNTLRRRVPAYRHDTKSTFKWHRQQPNTSVQTGPLRSHSRGSLSSFLQLYGL